jgi:hypothetical protein
LKEFEGAYSFDSSILLGMLAGTKTGNQITNLLVEGRVDAHTSYVNIGEAEYVICRKVGHEIARNKVQNLIESNFVDIVPVEQLLHLASRIKCERSIAFGDCFCIAAAEATGSEALFASKEKEIVKEMRRQRFRVKIGFLEELVDMSAP